MFFTSCPQSDFCPSGSWAVVKTLQESLLFLVSIDNTVILLFSKICYLLFHLLALCPGCCFYQIITPCIDPLIFPLNFTEQSLLACGQARGPAGGFSIDPSRPLHTTFHPHYHCDSEDALSAPDSGTFNSTGLPAFCSQAFANPDLLTCLNPKAPQLNTSIKKSCWWL